jgi:hypothetical protein
LDPFCSGIEDQRGLQCSETSGLTEAYSSFSGFGCCADPLAYNYLKASCCRKM